MNYEQTIEYIHSISWRGSRPGLERINVLLEKLGNPQIKLKVVHVAGTNGKGSFCAMLESILRNSGYKTGMFTSPYIEFFNERMQINGDMISNEELAQITDYVKPIAEGMTDPPTEFELITAIAIEYFVKNKCDIVIMEAGMGGRLDSTNVFDQPLLSVITEIGLDHTAFLGNTIEKISKEKAGIIKEGCPVLFGGKDINAAMVIKETASEKNSDYYQSDYNLLSEVKCTLSGSTFNFGNLNDIYIPLLGLYQPLNAANVISAIQILNNRGLDISENDIREGLKKVKWSGRFERLSDNPEIYFDGSHNPQGIKYAIDTIKHYFGEKKVNVLAGVMKDKDYEEMIHELAAITDRAFCVTPR